MAKDEMSLGDVPLELNGEPVVLRCTLRAWRDINRFFGSFTDAFQRLAKFDSDAYVTIIASGLGKPAKEIEEAVFFHGVSELATPVTKFLNMLSNGGRTGSDGEPKKGEG